MINKSSNPFPLRTSRPLPASASSQRGAVLIVSLVILLVVTLFGVSNMQSSSIQMKMAENNASRQTVFAEAESALKTIEDALLNDLHVPDDYMGCAPGSTSCYDNLCAGGLCFNGEFLSGSTAAGDCRPGVDLPPAPSGVDPRDPYWVRSDANLDVWNNATQHQTLTVSATALRRGVQDAKYIVEFMCYVDKDSGGGATCSVPFNDCSALYRVTAYVTNSDESARVMLQSTVKQDLD